MDKFWVVCSGLHQCDGTVWDDTDNNCSVANGIFTSKAKAHAFIEHLRKQYDGKTDYIYCKVCGPFMPDIGHSIGDDRVFDGKKWIKLATLKARQTKKNNKKTRSIGPDDRPIDMDFDFALDFGDE